MGSDVMSKSCKGNGGFQGNTWSERRLGTRVGPGITGD